MKSIKWFVLFGILLFMLTACSKHSESDIESLSFSQSVVLPPDASEQVVTLDDLSSPVATTQSSAAWLTVEPQPYFSGSPQVKLRSTSNADKGQRKCAVTVVDTSDKKVILSVTQQGFLDGIDDMHDSQTDKPAYSRQRHNP